MVGSEEDTITEDDDEDTKITDAGLRYIPLRTPGGELISQSGLFVRIHKETVLNGGHQYNGGKIQGGRF